MKIWRMMSSHAVPTSSEPSALLRARCHLPLAASQRSDDADRSERLPLSQALGKAPPPLGAPLRVRMLHVDEAQPILLC